jgi:hypothetical protein
MADPINSQRTNAALSPRHPIRDLGSGATAGMWAADAARAGEKERDGGDIGGKHERSEHDRLPD